MAGFVLVPGGWYGGWVYDPVVAQLENHGHQATAVTLAGLEADPGPGTPNLDTHIAQVVDAVRARSAGPLVLCGHSYGGMVITGVAEAVPELIDHVVYIDAYVPEDGDSCWTLTTDKFRALFVDGARGDGRSVAVPRGVDPRARPHPVASFLQAVSLPGGRRHELPRTFVSGGAWPGSPFGELVEALTADPRWTVHDIPVGHNIMRHDPDALAAVLADLAPGGEGDR